VFAGVGVDRDAGLVAVVAEHLQVAAEFELEAAGATAGRHGPQGGQGGVLGEGVVVGGQQHARAGVVGVVGQRAEVQAELVASVVHAFVAQAHVGGGGAGHEFGLEALVGVEHNAGLNVQIAQGLDARGAVLEAIGRQGHVARAQDECAALVADRVAGLDGQVFSRGDDGVFGVENAVSADGQLVAVETGAVVNNVRLDAHVDAIDQAGVGEVARRAQDDVLLADDLGACAVLDARGLNVQAGVALQAALVDQAPVGQQHEFALGREHALVVHPQALLRADKEDVVGVHAADGGHVEQEAGGLAQGGGRPRGFMRAGVHGVGAVDHLEVVGPQAGVHLGGAREDAQVVGAARVQAGTEDAHAAALHDVGIERAALQDRGAGGEGDARGVDERGAVDLDARGVGDDDLGALAGDFDGAVEEAGVAGVDFVEDDAGGARR